MSAVDAQYDVARLQRALPLGGATWLGLGLGLGFGFGLGSGLGKPNT